MKENLKFAGVCVGLFCLILKIQAKVSDLYGTISCNGKGVAGVVVTDGTDCVRTDQQGQYRLEGKRDVRFVYLSTPAGYRTIDNRTLPQFYQKVDKQRTQYDFELTKNKLNDTKHICIVQADAQMSNEENVNGYRSFLEKLQRYAELYEGKTELFGIDCGDIGWDIPEIYLSYIKAVNTLDFPVYRAIGNHDMTYGGRSFETSFITFEKYFGPTHYSFNKGKVHYIVINNCFYIDRDYQYIGYITEQTFCWMEQDLKYVPKSSPVFVVMHIPASSTKKLQYNALLPDETSNAQGLFDVLKGYDAHLITGHTHFNLNVCFNDSLMEHNTAAVCGIWWKANICMDGTPQGFGVYEVDGTHVKWKYVSAGYPDTYQFRAYPVGRDKDNPECIVANVWNYDDLWKVQWLENGRLMGNMEQFTGYDPEAKAICADKKRVEYDWISPVTTTHLFKAVPKDEKADIEVRVTDRFGNVYTQRLKNQ